MATGHARIRGARGALDRAWVFISATLVAGCTCTKEPAAPSPPRSLIDVGDGLTLGIHCLGRGEPLVVFDSGLGNDGTVWDEVQADVAALTEACVYDRAGTGASNAARRPHTNRQMARELRELLVRTKHDGPYVFVGHSMGGVNVRLLASERPDDVAGMVLVDAMSDDVPARYWALIPQEAMSQFRTGLKRLPEGIDFDVLAAGIAEMRRSSTSLGDKPLAVLTRGKEDAPPWATPELTSKLLAAWHDTQATLPRLSKNSIHVVAKNSRHVLQKDAPRLVGAAIRDVIEACRAGAKLDPTRLSALAEESPVR